MSIVKMKKLRLIGFEDDKKQLLKRLQRLGCVEITAQENKLVDPDWADMVVMSASSAPERKLELQQVNAAISTLNAWSPVRSPILAPKPSLSQKTLFSDDQLQKAMEYAELVNDLAAKLKAADSTISRQESMLVSLKPWQSIDIPLEFESTKNVSVHFGVCPSSISLYEARLSLSETAPESELILASEDREQYYLLLICHKTVNDAAITSLRSYGWSASALRGVTGTAKENIAKIEAQIAQTRQQRQQLAEEIRSMGQYRDALKIAADRLAQDLNRESAEENLLDTDKTFYLEGWAAEPELDKLNDVLGQFLCAWELSDPEEGDDVPVQLRNGKLTAPLNMVTEMYSLPAYDGIDPNPLMMPFFCLFYGIMFADMGYGIIMVAVSLFVNKKAKPTGTMKNLFDLMFLCGIPTFIMGALTGGFFGDAPYQLAKMLDPDTAFTGLPKLFDPLNDTLYVLVGAMALDFIQIIAGMIIKFVMTTRDGHFWDAVMDQGSWWLLFIGIGVGALSGVWWVAIAGVLALVLTQGRSKPTLIGKLVGGISSLYDVTGYFGDILSYSRLMALMLAGSVIAQVFNTLAAMPGNIIAFFVIFALGHALNFGLNLLGCFVHNLRLQCLEYFGKFYKDGGRPFKPLNIKAKYHQIID